MTPFEYQIFQDTQKKELIKQGDRILLSFSTGADSTALFHILLAFQKHLNFYIQLIHFNHETRNECDEEEEFAIQSAVTHQIPISVFRKGNQTSNVNAQNSYREWRKKRLKQTASAFQCNRIATAHHLDDLAESQLWRLCRGANLFTFDALECKQADFIRPLLSIRKQQLIEYLEQNKIQWREDSSNKSSKYTRNKIRNHVLPLLEEIGGKEIYQKLNSLAEDSKKLRNFFEDNYGKESRSEQLEFEQILNAGSFFGLELIHRFLIHKQVKEIKRKNLNEIMNLVRENKNAWKINLNNHVVVKGENFRLIIENNKERTK